MLYLDPNKEKVLTFEVDMSGDACDEITSHVRLYVEDVELGFPAELKENKIRALIKPLRTLVKFPLRSGTLIFYQRIKIFIVLGRVRLKLNLHSQLRQH